MKLSRYIKNDKLYLKLMYFFVHHEILDFHNPTNYTQKIQCLKLLNNTDICTKMVDKYEVRKLISKTIGEKYLIPLLGVWDNFEDIDFDKLPDKFVLKTTHDSGGVIICKDKSCFNFDNAKRILQKKLSKNYFWNGREYPYKNVKPRIIAEKYMVDESGVELKDYKFFCFSGEPKLVFLASSRFIQKVPYFDFFDAVTRKRLPIIAEGHQNSSIDTLQVENYDEMLRLARDLSKDFIHLRVDFYNINGRVYFGEFTFHHDGGFVPFRPAKWNKILGDYINLSCC